MAAYNILVGIHENVEAEALGHSQYFDRMLDPLFVVLAWSLMFDSLPGEDVPDGIVPPASQSGKVVMGILDSKRPVYKGNMIALKEAIGHMGGLIRIRGKLCVSGHVDTMERDFSPVMVPKGALMDLQTKRSHEE